MEGYIEREWWIIQRLGPILSEWKRNDVQCWGYSGRRMMNTKEVRVKGLCKDHIVKLGPVVDSGAMKIAAIQGYYNISGEVEGPSVKG